MTGRRRRSRDRTQRAALPDGSGARRRRRKGGSGDANGGKRQRRHHRRQRQRRRHRRRRRWWLCGCEWTLWSDGVHVTAAGQQRHPAPLLPRGSPRQRRNERRHVGRVGGCGAPGGGQRAGVRHPQDPPQPG
ncbi:hypothetical protein PLESTM_001689200, partial [Pleodorina starrii]